MPVRAAEHTRQPRIIGGVAALPGNAEVADRFDLLADLLELEGAESFRVLAYRRAATRMRETSASVAQLALDGRAKELQGIGKTIEEKIVQIVETGEIDALAKRRALVPPDVVAFMHLPGLGPKTAARIWHELGITTLAELKEAAEAERLRTLAGLGAKSEEKILKALAFQAENPDAGRRLLGDGLPAVQAVVAALREHPAAVAVSEAGSVRRRKETFRDLDIIATATDPAELHGVLHAARLGRGGRRTRRHEGDRRLARGAPLRPARRAAGVVRQPAAALHGLEGAQRRAARGRACGAGSRSRSTASRTSRRETSSRRRTRTRSTSSSATSRSRRSCARTPASSRRRGAASCPSLVELSRSRGDLHTHTTWSADGKNTLEEMVAAAVARGYEYYAITDHSHYLREGRLAAQLEEIERVRDALPEAPHPRRRRGEHPRERRGRRRGGGARAPRLGRRLRPPGAGHAADRARARGDGQSVRRLHRASHRAADRQARPARRRRRARHREGGRDRLLRSRSTASRTGSTCATCTRARRRRPA